MLEPLTKVPAVGAPTAALGAVLSTTTTPAPPGCRSICETFDAESVICARRCHAPSPGVGVFQSTVYAPAVAVVSVPIVVQPVVPLAEYWKATESMPAPLSLGVAVRVTVPDT